MTTDIATLTSTGTGLLWKPIDERDTFHFGDKELEFVDYWPTKGNSIHIIRAAEKFSQMGDCRYEYHYVSLFHICLDDLKKMELWTILSEDLKKQLELRHVTAQENGKMDADNHKTEMVERMAHARRHRSSDPEYDGIPRTLTCTNPNCGNMDKTIKISPMMVIKQAQCKKQTVEEYVASYQCSECQPRHRGRAPLAKWLNMPRELRCHFEGCTVVLAQHPSMIEKQANASGKKFTEFVNTWLCREHREKKEHHFSSASRALRDGKKGRPRNPAYAEIPKETSCIVCKSVVKLVPDNIIGKAKILGITVKELIATYKCRRCGGRLKKQSKKK